jgi:uncharacterized membrane protein
LSKYYSPTSLQHKSSEKHKFQPPLQMSATTMTTTTMHAKTRGPPRCNMSMTRSQLLAKAALKTARSASTKAQTHVRKAIARVNATNADVELFIRAVAQAARDAEIERRIAGESSIVTGTGMASTMDIYESSSSDENGPAEPVAIDEDVVVVGVGVGVCV